MPLIAAPQLLLVGSSGRNAGKTEFACGVLRAQEPGRPVAAVKATTVHERDGTCARGGEGCGACTTFDGPFCLTREDGTAEEKDTGRLLAAGASPVYWLRAHQDHLAEAARALLRVLGPATPWICESNSLAAVVEPGAFVVVHDRSGGPIKESCREVWDLADDVVLRDGGSFAPDPASFAPAGGGWTWKRRAAAIVLAGGRSARMGRDKALLRLDRRPLVEHVARQLEPLFSAVLVSAAHADDYGFLGLRVVPDRIADGGPLAALAGALDASPLDVNLVVPCDVPEVPGALVRLLLREARRGDGAVPVDADGNLEPLFAVYRKSVLPAVRDAVARGDRKVTSFYRACSIARVAMPAGLRLWNLNTMAEVRAYRDSRRKGPGRRGR
jgi:molybdenum cofactor guanylyltransferase